LSFGFKISQTSAMAEGVCDKFDHTSSRCKATHTPFTHLHLKKQMGFIFFKSSAENTAGIKLHTFVF
jgi:hypothetical protein